MRKAVVNSLSSIINKKSRRNCPLSKNEIDETKDTKKFNVSAELVASGVAGSLGRAIGGLGVAAVGTAVGMPVAAVAVGGAVVGGAVGAIAGKIVGDAVNSSKE